MAKARLVLLALAARVAAESHIAPLVGIRPPDPIPIQTVGIPELEPELSDDAHYGPAPQPVIPAYSFAVQPARAPELADDRCANVLKCISRFPVKDDDPSGPPSLIPGVPIDPTRTAGPNDPNCPSGRCIIVDPTELCDGSLPHCLPISNIKPPYLPCAKKNPKCPNHGILLDPESSCHLLDSNCPPGGVVVPTLPCKKGSVDCSKLRPWITPGGDITNRPKWPPVHDEPDHPLNPDTPIPGIEFDPTNLCSPKTLACRDPEHGVVVDLDSKCDARKPGCISFDNLHDPILTPDDPKCKPRAIRCAIVNMHACHPNDPQAPPGCIKTDPIPCIIGQEGCHSGLKLPDPVQPCVPKSLGCGENGFIVVVPPLVHHTEPPIPSGTPALVIDPKGPFTCAMIAVKPQLKIPAKPASTVIVRESVKVTVTTTRIYTPAAQVTTAYETVTTTTTSTVAAQISTKTVISTTTSTLAAQISTKTVTTTSTSTAAAQVVTQTSTQTVTKTTTTTSTSTAAAQVVTQTSTQTVTKTTTSIPAAQTSIETVTKTTCPVTAEASPKATEAPKPVEPVKPKTKYPCSPDEANPCKDTLVTGWTPFFVQWSHNPHWGPPNPFVTSINYDVDTIMQVTDDRLKVEVFDISLDGVMLGKTSPVAQNWYEQCGTDAEGCMARGYSQGYFNIPKGHHTLTISWNTGLFGQPNDGPGAGQYRFFKACTC